MRDETTLFSLLLSGGKVVASKGLTGRYFAVVTGELRGELGEGVVMQASWRQFACSS